MTLLTHNRLDVAIKLVFLEGLNRGSKRAEELYREHIRLFTLGSFKEPGNEAKNSIEDFVESFKKLALELRDSGFDADKSLVPLGMDGTILNGAHRVAASIFHGVPVKGVYLPLSDSMYDYRFFLSRGMDVDNVEVAVTKFLEVRENCFIACVWPRAEGRDDSLDGIFPNIVYKKRINLSLSGAHNVLSEVYAEEPWLGPEEEGFPGVKGKLMECFTGSAPLRVYVFQADSLDEVVGIKERVRELFRVGKHSVHITDTHEESVRIGRVLLNANSLHFMEHGTPSKFRKTLDQIRRYSDELKDYDVHPDNVIVDGSLILALYGLREARDVDYLIADDVNISGLNVDSHDSELKYHGVSKSDLLRDNEFFFYYRGLKFVALHQLAEMKKNRSEEKDHADLRMMAPLISRSRTSSALLSLRGRLAFFRAQLSRIAVQLLKKFGVYAVTRKFYRSVKRSFRG